MTTVTLSAADDGYVWHIAGPLQISTAEEALKASRELVTRGDWTIDLKQVTVIDSAAVSLLLAWRRRAAREGHEVRFVQLPAALSTLLDLYDVGELVSV